MKERDIRPQDLFDEYLELARRDVDLYFGDHDLFTSADCPACEHGETSQSFVKFGFKYVTCLACGSLFNSPRPPQRMMDRYIRESESVKFWASRFYKETESSRRERLFAPRAELVHKVARSYGLTGTTFADVGSGYGVLLQEIARVDGFDEVIGIEPAPDLAQVCRDKGFRVVEKLAEDMEPGEISAGVITSFEVLEHLYEPGKFLEGIWSMLQPGGVLLLTTLTCSGFDIQLLREHSKSIYPPHHISLMSVDGIEQLVKRCGFDLLELTTPGRLDVDIVYNIVAQDPSIELPRFAKQIIHNSADDVKANFQEFLSNNRLSSHIRVIARKPLGSA